MSSIATVRDVDYPFISGLAAYRSRVGAFTGTAIPGARNEVSRHPVGQKTFFSWRRMQSRRPVSWFAFYFEDLLQGKRCPDFFVWV